MSKGGTIEVMLRNYIREVTLQIVMHYTPTKYFISQKKLIMPFFLPIVPLYTCLCDNICSRGQEGDPQGQKMSSLSLQRKRVVPEGVPVERHCRGISSAQTATGFRHLLADWDQKMQLTDPVQRGSGSSVRWELIRTSEPPLVLSVALGREPSRLLSKFSLLNRRGTDLYLQQVCQRKFKLIKN